MTGVIFAVIVAALICGLMWRRPDVRAAVSGAWQEGKAQAAQEFREGYEFAQQHLRAGDPSWKSPRRWTSWLLASAWGAGQTVVAANRIRARAWDGGRTRYCEWQAAQPVDAEVLEEPDPEVNACVGCGSRDVRWWSQISPPDWYCPPCGAVRRHEQTQPDPDPDPDEQPNPDPDPDQQQPDQPHEEEEPDMQTEATGLTSYAAAHTQFATELRAQMSGSENLAASMSGILAEHSDLIGQTAVLQDLLNQAATISDQIAERATTVANN